MISWWPLGWTSLCSLQVTVLRWKAPSIESYDELHHEKVQVEAVERIVLHASHAKGFASDTNRKSK